MWAIRSKESPRKEVSVNKKLISLRSQREKISKNKLLKLLKTLKLLKEIDTIEAVFLTGSVAVFNAKENSDIDLMIVTKPGQLWLTRLKILRLLKRLKLGRNKNHIKDRICTNIFLDANHLEIKEKNLYTAHEVLQARCVFDRGGIAARWLGENVWTRKYLPKAFLKTNQETKTPKPMSNLQLPKFQFGLLELASWLLEAIAFALQLLYMWPKMTNEKVGLGYAFFHPVDGSKIFRERFKNKLRGLGIMKSDEVF